MSARRDKARVARRRHLMALFAGGASALAMLSVPVPLIEMLVSSTGLSEVLPAAAPPLGFTARAAMAGFAAVLGFSASLALSPKNATATDVEQETAAKAVTGLAKGESTMGFALSKLTSLTRGRPRNVPAEQGVGGFAQLGEPLPVLRRADAHPDAPARRPISAARDFGGVNLFGQPIAVEPEPVELAEVAPVAETESLSDGETLVMPRSPEPMDDRALLTEAIEALPSEGAVAPEPVARVPLDGLSIAELVERFEQGIVRRKSLAQAAHAARQIDTVLAQTGKAPVPIASAAGDAARVLADIPPVPAVDVRRDVDAEVDEALRAALETLQRMTSR